MTNVTRQSGEKHRTGVGLGVQGTENKELDQNPQLCCNGSRGLSLLDPDVLVPPNSQPGIPRGTRTPELHPH
ncbi:hypothetical protein ILYODFUR_023869 [Ilyodon furcidens]|uniref:Uncharacterized protein n=1 Tax=Ilyodon furcidens TaxID=33524 RepID=A0ABV0SPN6_9TELE